MKSKHNDVNIFAVLFTVVPDKLQHETTATTSSKFNTIAYLCSSSIN